MQGQPHSGGDSLQRPPPLCRSLPGTYRGLILPSSHGRPSPGLRGMGKEGEAASDLGDRGDRFTPPSRPHRHHHPLRGAGGGGGPLVALPLGVPGEPRSGHTGGSSPEEVAQHIPPPASPRLPPTRGHPTRGYNPQPRRHRPAPPSPRRDAPLWRLPQFPLAGMGYSEGGGGVAQELTGGCRAPRGPCTAHPALRGGCTPPVHPKSQARRLSGAGELSPRVAPTGPDTTPAAGCANQRPLGAAPCVRGEARRYLFRGCLQCRFTRKLLLSPSLPGWRGPEPWARGNHSAGGLAPFSSARGWQATELPSARERPPHISPAPPPPGAPPAPGCPRGWGHRGPPLDASPWEPQPTGTPPPCPSPHHGMPGVAF